ncbi:MAG: SUMF1/EgtB/PvdO family nonheme iron enzyme [Candidatus Hatepunaea meridiana]|nr:SUMF1/EgtB/PvdO family nonheme iron enzyme [Candidatus Hatepunaea meridiana]
MSDKVIWSQNRFWWIGCWLIVLLIVNHTSAMTKLVISVVPKDSTDLTLAAANSLRTELVNSNWVEVVSPDQDKIISEWVKILDPTTYSSKRDSFGNLTNARWVVILCIEPIRKWQRIEVRLVDILSGEVELSKDDIIEDSEESIMSSIPRLANELLSEIILNGYIFKDKESNRYLNAGQDIRLIENQQLSVWRPDSVYNKSMNKYFSKTSKLGRIEITKIGKETSRFIMIDSFEFKKGDYVELHYRPKVKVIRQGFGALEISTVPNGALVRLEGNKLGTTPYSSGNIKEGKYELYISKEGYQDTTIVVWIIPNATTPLPDIELIPIMGDLVVITKPNGALVVLDGDKLLGITNRSDGIKQCLQIGAYKLFAFKEHYYPDSTSVVIMRNKPISVTIVLNPKPGTLIINTIPHGASIILDKQDTYKVTPDTIRPISAGKHEMSLYLSGFKLKNFPIIIEPEQIVHLNLIHMELEEIESDILAASFVYVPGGTFNMGSSKVKCEDSSTDEQYVREVTIESFWMQKTEVTQEQWRRIIGMSIYDQVSLAGDSIILENSVGNSFPMYFVSWEDVQKFIETLNKSDSTRIYRLPTESEWEYACRAYTTTRFYTGNSYRDLDVAGWFTKRVFPEDIHPVALKKSNILGMYDMHGNVAEWCWDHYHNSYKKAPIDGTAMLVFSEHRILRGGSCYDYASKCRSAARGYAEPNKRSNKIGFRLVMKPVE